MSHSLNDDARAIYDRAMARAMEICPPEHRGRIQAMPCAACIRRANAEYELTDEDQP